MNGSPLDLAWATNEQRWLAAHLFVKSAFILSETSSPTVALFPFVILGEQVRLIFNRDVHIIRSGCAATGCSVASAQVKLL